MSVPSTNVLAIDTETTIYNKGNPFDSRNYLVCYSFSDGVLAGTLPNTTGCHIELSKRIAQADLLILFNAKFDLHWLRNNGIDFSDKRIWDCQLAEFILSNQTWAYPSLDEACAKRGLPRKIDIVATEYWAKGIQTDQIPWPILEEYATQDAVCTYQLYLEQQKLLTGNKLKLFNLQCLDLLLLQDMEYTGLYYDAEKCEQRAEELEVKAETIRQQLDSIYPGVPINFGSNDQLSAFLYGGTIVVDSKEHVGFFKSGQKVGQPKYKKVEILHTLPRQYEPLKGSEMAKEGIYSTSEDTLLKLAGRKGTITLLLELSKLDKLISTYYRGLPKLNVEMYWPPGELHGQFNQCTTRTGRLSSSRPNQQNMAGEVDSIFISRYSD